MENEVLVFGLRVCESDYFQGRSRMLAFFDCDVRGMRLHGCALLLKGKSLLVSGPRMSPERGVRFIDNDLAEQVKQQALKLFHQFGGAAPEEEVAHLPEGVRAMLTGLCREGRGSCAP